MSTTRFDERLARIQRQSAGVQPPTRAWAGRFEVTNFAADNPEVWLYAEIGGPGGVAAKDFGQELRSLGGRDFTLRINSPGGSAFEGLSMYELLCEYRGQVSAMVDGLAASAASLVMLGADEILASPGAQVLIHPAHGVAVGSPDDFTFMAGTLRAMDATFSSLYARKAGGDADTWLRRIRANGGRGTWFSAEEAVELGLADRILEAEAQLAPAIQASLFRVRNEWGQARTESVAMVTAKAIVTAVQEAIGGGVAEAVERWAYRQGFSRRWCHADGTPFGQRFANQAVN